MTVTELDNLISAVVRIISRQGGTAGTGFVIAGDLIASCAHVLVSAGAQADGEVQVEFPRAGVSLWARSEPEYWRAPEHEDVAVLHLGSPLPDGVKPLAFKRSTGSQGNRFMTYGFPDVPPLRGLWGYGVIGGPIYDQFGIRFLQLSETTETAPGFSGAPVIDQITNRVVGMVNSITPGDRYGRLTQTAFATPTETIQRICHELQVADVCPYRGLEVFEEEHAQFFFGRGRTLVRLLERLRGEPRLLIVLGPSGSGKSSLVRAGLIPRLRGGALPDSQRWNFIITRPSELERLAQGELRYAMEDLPAATMAWLAHHPESSRCVLIVDQFEELFAALSEASGTIFVRQIWDLLESAVPASILIVMRDEFYSRLAGAAPPSMAEWIERTIVQLPSVIEESDLVEIIEKPALGVGMRLGADLVQTIVADALQARDEGERVARSTVLPLLEFALTQLWERQQNGVLLVGAYHDLGGVGGAVTQWADRAYRALPGDQRELCRRILPRLVYLGNESLGVPDSRRRRRLGELQDLASARTVDEVVAWLVNQRLLATRRDDATGQVTVELIHDSLLREWQQLRDWLRSDREFLTWRQQLDQRMQSWVKLQGSEAEEDSDWLQGRELRAAVDWLNARGDELGPQHQAFIRGSWEAWQRELQREKMLKDEADRQRAEADRHRQRAARREATARLLLQADQVLALLPADPLGGLLLALTVVGANLADSPEELLAPVQLSLHAALQTARERSVMYGHEAPVRSVALSHDSQLIASAGDDRSIRLWDRGGSSIGDPLVGHEEAITSLAFSPRQGQLASGGRDRMVALWTVQGRLVSTFVGHDDSVTSIAFSPDGRLIASGGDDRTVRLWDEQGAAFAPPFLGHEDFVTSVAFSPDGQHIVSGSGDGTVRLWDLGGEPMGVPFVGHEDFVTSVAFSPDGQHIVSGSGDGTVRLWDLGGRLVGQPFDAHDGFVNAVIFDAQGTALISVGDDRAVRVWTLTRIPILDPLIGHTNDVTSVAVGSSGDVIVTGSIDRTVRVWDWQAPIPCRTRSVGGRRAAARRSVERAESARPHLPMHIPPLWDGRGDQAQPAWLGHEGFVRAVAFAPDGQVIVSGGGDRTLRFWDLSGRELAVIERAHEASIIALAFSQDGRMIASGGRDRTVRLWNPEGRTLGPILQGHRDDVMAVAFSPDGRTIASGGNDGALHLWDGQGAPLLMLAHAHDDAVTGASFASDGSIVTCSIDGTVRIRDAKGQLLTSPFKGHQGDVQSVAVSRDGLVVTAGVDRTLRFWTLRGEAVGRTEEAHADEIRAVGFSRDCRTVLSASLDGTIRLWDREGNRLTRPFRGHRGAVLAATFGCRDDLIASGGFDGTVRLWRAGNWKRWVHAACERLAEHPALRQADSEEALSARAMCETMVWNLSPE